MTWIFVWDTNPSKIYVGDTAISKVFVSDTQVRPTWWLPSAYQEVEYIQSSWTQWIDTWVTATTSTKAEIKLNSQYIAESAIFWARWALDGYFLMFYNNRIRWHWASAVDVACSTNTDYTIETENGKVTVNGTSYTCTASSAILTWYNLGLFATWNQGSAYTRGRFKLYYFKIWDWTTLQRDFISCYRKSDSVIGLYDLVTNTFFTNSWTWTFTKWWDV